VINWARTASRDDLIDWNIEEQSEEVLLPVNSLPEADSQGQWLLDRFTSTYLDQWRTESLRREWNHIHSQESAPCSVAEMRLRVLTIDELSKIMAERLASTRRHHPSVTTQLVLPAVKLALRGNVGWVG